MPIAETITIATYTDDTVTMAVHDISKYYNYIKERKRVLSTRDKPKIIKFLPFFCDKVFLAKSVIYKWKSVLLK